MDTDNCTHRPGVIGKPCHYDIAERLRQSIEEPFAVENFILGVSASIGVAIYPDDGLDEETLQVNADQAMYQAKSRGGNAVALNAIGIADKRA